MAAVPDLAVRICPLHRLPGGRGQVLLERPDVLLRFAIGYHYSRYFSIVRISAIIILAGIFPILISILYYTIDGFHERLRGAAGHPNMLAFFLFFYISFCYHGLVWGWIKSKALRNVAIVFCALATLELLLTGTRSAFVAMFAFLLVSTLRRPIWLLMILPARFLRSPSRA